MHEVVDKLLRLARAENGIENLHKVDVDLRAFLRISRKISRVLCEQKRIIFEQDLAGCPIINGDMIRLRELFSTFWIMPLNIHLQAGRSNYPYSPK